MAETTKKSVFETLSKVDCSGKVEKIGKLSYLSWAFAWKELKKAYPSAFYTIYENADGWNYHTDGRTCWVKTGVTIDGLEHIEYLPVMNNQHKSIPLEQVTSFNVNTAIQRSLTKACARHGLGLSVYTGEDLIEMKEAEALSEDLYMKLVIAGAENRKCKNGEDPREWYINHEHPSEFELMQFDDDVAAYKANPKTK